MASKASLTLMKRKPSVISKNQEYEVIKACNTLDREIGDLLTKKEVEDLMVSGRLDIYFVPSKSYAR